MSSAPALRAIKGGAGAPPPAPPGGGGGGGDPPKEDNSWQVHFRFDKRGPLATPHNIALILTFHKEWRNVLAYDAFSQRICFISEPPFERDHAEGEIPCSIQNPHVNPHLSELQQHVGREVTDADLTRAAMWLERKYAHGWKPSKSMVAEAMEVTARARAIHPVRNYLDSLEWDGKHRIGKPNSGASSWLSTYMGADDTPYVRSVGRWWLVSAIARIYNPGCQADHTLILEGDEGIRKSTALRALGEPWFTDDLEDITSKDALQQCSGVWIIEIGEMDAILRANEKTAQKFLTKQTDRYRPPYGSRPRDFPRQCVFAATTNKREYLRETTGNRRYHPVFTRVMRLDELRADRNQIWAEAKLLYGAGEPWWPVESFEISTLRSEQEDRVEQDPWFEIVHDWILDYRYKGNTTVTTAAVLKEACKVDTSKFTRADQMRVGTILSKCGCVRQREFDSTSGLKRYIYLLPQKVSPDGGGGPPGGGGGGGWHPDADVQSDLDMYAQMRRDLADEDKRHAASAPAAVAASVPLHEREPEPWELFEGDEDSASIDHA